MVTFNDWLADRQRLYSVVGNIFKLKKLQFTANDDLARYDFATGDMKGVENFVNAKYALDSMGFVDRFKNPITSTNALLLSKNDKGVIEVHTSRPSRVDVCVGTKFSSDGFEYLHEFDDDNEDFLQKYNDTTLVNVLGTNNMNMIEFRKSHAKAIIKDLMDIGFKQVPNKYKKNNAVTILFYNGLFVFCNQDFKVTWSNSL